MFLFCCRAFLCLLVLRLYDTPNPISYISAAGQWFWPVVLSSVGNSAGRWCWEWCCLLVQSSSLANLASHSRSVRTHARTCSNFLEAHHPHHHHLYHTPRPIFCTSVALQFAGQLGKYRARSAHSYAHTKHTRRHTHPHTHTHNTHNTSNTHNTHKHTDTQTHTHTHMQTHTPTHTGLSICALI